MIFKSWDREVGGSGAAAAIILSEADALSRHPFFLTLSASDRRFLAVLVSKFGRDGCQRAVLLPSGATILLLINKGSWTHRRALLAARQTAVLARQEKISRFFLNSTDFKSDNDSGSFLTVSRLAEVLAIQLTMANFEFSKYKTVPASGPFLIQEADFMVRTEDAAKFREGLRSGAIIGEEINHCRTLCNTPGGDMTPTMLAAMAAKTAKRAGFKIKVLGKKEIENLGMGGVIGVAKGSVDDPKFIVMEYSGGPKNQKPVVLVGKGVTFDTGGLNVKTENYMNEMHMDMTGGAAVIHALAAAARLKMKKNIVVLVPAVENSVSAVSYRPGDILRTMDGKTIEVLNTDAEGRIILADALCYARRYSPRLVIDVATLTGAAMRALGQRASAIFATDEKISRELQVVGEQVGDVVWPLPLWEDYEEEIKGVFGDVANVGKTAYGGAITAAVFLWQFIKGLPWVHIDIAPRMTSIEGEGLAKGSAGPAVGLLAAFLRDF